MIYWFFCRINVEKCVNRGIHHPQRHFLNGQLPEKKKAFRLLLQPYTSCEIRRDIFSEEKDELCRGTCSWRNYKLQIVIICRRKDPKSLFPSRRTLFLGWDNLTSSIRFVATYVCKRKYYTSLSAWNSLGCDLLYLYIYFFFTGLLYLFYLRFLRRHFIHWVTICWLAILSIDEFILCSKNWGMVVITFVESLGVVVGSLYFGFFVRVLIMMFIKHVISKEATGRCIANKLVEENSNHNTVL